MTNRTSSRPTKVPSPEVGGSAAGRVFSGMTHHLPYTYNKRSFPQVGIRQLDRTDGAAAQSRSRHDPTGSRRGNSGWRCLLRKAQLESLHRCRGIMIPIVPAAEAKRRTIPMRFSTSCGSSPRASVAMAPRTAPESRDVFRGKVRRFLDTAGYR